MLWQSSHSDLSTGSVKKHKDGRSGGRMMILGAGEIKRLQ